jgi:hypothetical protein
LVIRFHSQGMWLKLLLCEIALHDRDSLSSN